MRRNIRPPPITIPAVVTTDSYNTRWGWLVPKDGSTLRNDQQLFDRPRNETDSRYFPIWNWFVPRRTYVYIIRQFRGSAPLPSPDWRRPTGWVRANVYVTKIFIHLSKARFLDKNHSEFRFDIDASSNLFSILYNNSRPIPSVRRLTLAWLSFVMVNICSGNIVG